MLGIYGGIDSSWLQIGIRRSVCLITNVCMARDCQTCTNSTAGSSEYACNVESSGGARPFVMKYTASFSGFLDATGGSRLAVQI